MTAKPKTLNTSATNETNDCIAIVGSACRFPGDVKSPSQLWEVLQDPPDLVRELPDDRFSTKSFYHPNPQTPGHTYVRHAYTLTQDVWKFDAAFFNISPTEARAMDPQQRMLLEVTYEGLERAGFTIESLKGSNTGVFLGMMWDDYLTVQTHDRFSIPNYIATGAARSIAANRLSYFFDWHGPSMAIDTACSSSLVALHQAVRAIHEGDCDMAIVGGSNLMLGPETFVQESLLKMLSSDGRSKMWDRDGDGYGRGEGVAILVLKKMGDAMAHGDSVECIIRGIEINHDGHKPGLTKPNSAAQAELIRKTYSKAGLDILNPRDQCQFFEAHGTGTAAGDPTEAEAIFHAFGLDTNNLSQGHMYVGSIKTVIGHTESTAGVAGILKASLALQNGWIPPNLHLRNLNPAIEPFYGAFEVPSRSVEWPQSQTRRASINSFGFGGANAHVILESIEQCKPAVIKKPAERAWTPFVFSAQSKPALMATLGAFSTFLSKSEGIDPVDLAWTLRKRRSRFHWRVAYAAATMQSLREQIQETIAPVATEPGKAIGSAEGKMKILGVFTGQGAQYAQMGAELIQKSPYCSQIVRELQEELASLPPEDRPSWAIVEELHRDTLTTRIHDPEISQTLCTVVQTVLVRLLRQLGLEFSAVVGHSSGELAAAFAAGFLSARDAVLLAYFRGRCAKHARSSGAMLAVGTSQEDAAALCDLEEFRGKVVIAASNSSSSVTLAGDEEQIEQMRIIFEDEGKSCRRLKVAVAYHSHHMLPCSKMYREAIERHGIAGHDSQGGPRWFSSVFPKSEGPCHGPEYWIQNMLRPVLFNQAISNAVSQTECDMVVEVGPHPALKGPTMSTAQSQTSKSLVHVGTLERGKPATDALVETLASVWVHNKDCELDLESFEEQMGGIRDFSMVHDLPSYQWNHEHKFRDEKSRYLRASYHQRQRFHPLLGHLCPTSSRTHMQWRNVIRLSDNSWLRGHQIQGQVVFPAAGYLVAATETVGYLLNDNERVRLIELEDVQYHQSMIFQGVDEGVEVVFQLNEVSRSEASTISARFTHLGSMGPQDELKVMSSGRLCIEVGDMDRELLPPRQAHDTSLVTVHPEQFYTSLEGLGYHYSKDFRSLSCLKRSQGVAVGTVNHSDSEDPSASRFLVQPAVLDAGIQLMLLAYSYPRDGKLRSTHVPTKVDIVRINPALCHPLIVATSSSMDSRLQSSQYGYAGQITGDVEIYPGDNIRPAIQLGGLTAKPLTAPTAADDRDLVFTETWWPQEPDASLVDTDEPNGQLDDVVRCMERASLFYLRRLREEVSSKPLEKPTNLAESYLSYADYIISLVEAGRHPWVKKETSSDNFEDILAATASYSQYPEMRLTHEIGKYISSVVRGKIHSSEIMRADGLLDSYYHNWEPMRTTNTWISRIVQQISHRYPDMDVLEVGAGSGSATKSVLAHLDDRFASYTFTDISPAFFPGGEGLFKSCMDKATMKVLDISRNVEEQGFTPQSYDVIIAAHVLHVTPRLEDTLQNVRSLLRPGGYLIFSELTTNDVSRIAFIFGALPGWWAGASEGRLLGPHVSAVEWDALLRKTGFSGVDSIAGERHDSAYPSTVMVAQAIDNQVEWLYHPLWRASMQPIPQLVIVGGKSLPIARLLGHLRLIMSSSCQSLQSFQAIEDVQYDALSPDAVILSVVELDNPIFRNMNPGCLQSLKEMLASPRNILWLAEGNGEADMYGAMTLAFIRSACWEVPDIRFQFLRWDNAHLANASNIAEHLLRFMGTTSLSRDKTKDRLLWSSEKEVRIKDQLRPFIPRVEPVKPANDRYNSSVRSITQRFSPGPAQPIYLRLQHGRHSFERGGGRCLVSPADDNVILSVELSTTWPLRCESWEVFLVLGTLGTESSTYLALSPSVASHLVVPRHQLVDYAIPEGSSKQSALTLVVSCLLAEIILNGMGHMKTLLVHNPPKVLGNILELLASERNVHLTLSASENKADTPATWISMLPYFLPQRIQSMLPTHADRTVDLTAEHDMTKWGVSQFTGSHGQLWSLKTLFGGNSDHGKETKECTGWDVLGHAIRQTRSSGLQNLLLTESYPIVTPNELLDTPRPFTLLNWAMQERIPVTVTNAGSKMTFRDDRSYWLAGISGSLCESLCEWMIRQGARYIVISSRNPQLERVWLDQTSRLGATVIAYSSDITDYSQLEQLYQRLCIDLPPIAGVAHGAMILRDTPLRDMTHDNLCTVLAPKVQGGRNLDRLFWDKPLDFFILLSSVASVVGHAGQANYAAANGFLDALASYRRQRGLAASSINIGAVSASDAVAGRTGAPLLTSILGRRFTALSESDFHEAFAEAIALGTTDVASGTAIVTGLDYINHEDKDASFVPIWTREAKFSSLVTTKALPPARTASRMDNSSIEHRLRRAKTDEEVRTIVMDTVCNRLRRILQLSPDTELSCSTRTDQLGLDSLIAVDLRSWLSRTYSVHVPALKVMAGMEIGELVQLIIENLDTELVGILNETDTFPPDADGLIVEEEDDETSGSPPLRGSNLHTSTAASESGLKHTSEMEKISHETRSTSSIQCPSDNDVCPSGKTAAESVGQTQRQTESTGGSFDCPTDHKLEVVRSGRLSSSQSMFWFVDSLMRQKSTLNHTLLYRIHGTPDIANLEQALNNVVMRHDALHTRIRYKEATQELVQEVLQDQVIFLETTQIQQASDLDILYEELNKHQYDISSGRAMRVIFIRSTKGVNFLLIGYHHIIIDGASHAIVMRDLQDAYQGKPLAAKGVQFLDYVQQEQEMRESQSWKEDITYWKGILDPLPEPLPVHRSRVTARPVLTEYEMHRLEFTLSHDTHSELSQLSQAHCATPFHVYLAAFQVLLFRFLGVQDLCIGIGDANRWDTDNEKQDSVGPYVNLVPLRFKIDQGKTLANVIEATRHTSYASLRHAQVPFQDLLSDLRIARTATHSPVFQAFLDYRLASKSGDSLGDCRLDLERWDIAQLGYDFMVDISPHPTRGMSIAMHVQKSLYGEAEAQILAHGLEDILREFVAAPCSPAGRQWKSRMEDINKVLEVGRGDSVASTWPTTIPHRFDLIGKKYSELVAVKESSGATVTYSELLCRINSIATCLLNHGLKRGAHVAVYQEPSVDLVASILAILKAGGIYVPLDLSNPPRRLAAIVQSVKPKILLLHDTTSGHEQDLELNEDILIINVSVLRQQGRVCGSRALANGPAIILHTSGTTGIPKGVLLTHSNLRNQIEFSKPLTDLKPGHVVLHQSALSFDLSLAQIISPLCYGATVYVAQRELRYDPRQMTRLINSESITHTVATPTEYRSWLKTPDVEELRTGAWSTACIIGEVVRRDLLDSFQSLQKANLRLYNMYGPCETTIWSTATEIQYCSSDRYGREIPVGRPCNNERIYIVDEMLHLQPIGLPGEIVIGGAGVAQGYVNLDDDTQASFLRDTFESSHVGRETMYRTGDRGRFLADGQLLVEGRLAGDTVVKIRGIRIDLQDVEQNILRAGKGTLVDVAVSVRQGSDPASAYLVAHIVFSQTERIGQRDQHQLLRRLRGRLDLPHIMCPAVIPIDELPRTVSGKLDRVAVQKLAMQSADSLFEHVEDLPTFQARIKQLWQSVIPYDLVGTGLIDGETDFFHAGGNSMSLIDLHRTMIAEFQSSISLLDLFQHSTLDAMSALMSRPAERGTPASDNLMEDRDHINWDKETAPIIQELIFQDGSVHRPCPLPRTIVVTGATGFLGQSLLAALDRHPQVTAVICLAVRALSGRQKQLRRFQKVEYVEGDLTLPLLGVDQSTLYRVFNKADAVIHNGADTSQAKAYTTVRPANLESTKILASLCASRRIPLHYISTASVLLLGRKDEQGIDLNRITPPTSNTFGYISSKWASERYLSRVSEKYGLPITIYRPSQLVSGTTADGAKPNFAQTFLDYAQRLQKVPDIPRIMEILESIPVDQVAKEIMKSVLGNHCGTDLTYHFPRNETAMQSVGKMLLSRNGIPLPAVALSEWIQCAENVGMSSSLIAVFQQLEKAVGLL